MIRKTSFFTLLVDLEKKTSQDLTEKLKQQKIDENKTKDDDDYR